jgi:hypothetical protein
VTHDTRAAHAAADALTAAAGRLTDAIARAGEAMTAAPTDRASWAGAVAHAHAVAAEMPALVPPLLPALAGLPSAMLRDALTMARDLLTAGDLLAVLAPADAPAH